VLDDSGAAETGDRGTEEALAQVGQHVSEVVAAELGDGLPEVEDGLLDEVLVPFGVAGDVVEEGVLLRGREPLGDREALGRITGAGGPEGGRSVEEFALDGALVVEVLA
jgi:hypothetical protein